MIIIIKNQKYPISPYFVHFPFPQKIGDISTVFLKIKNMTIYGFMI